MSEGESRGDLSEIRKHVECIQQVLLDMRAEARANYSEQLSDIRNDLEEIRKAVCEPEHPDYSEEFSTICWKLEQVRKEIESADWSQSALDGELGNVASHIEEQATFTRMNITENLRGFGLALWIIALSCVFMVHRFWPPEWRLHF